MKQNEKIEYLERVNDIEEFNQRLEMIEDCEVFNITTQDEFLEEINMFNAVGGLFRKKIKMELQEIVHRIGEELRMVTIENECDIIPNLEGVLIDETEVESFISFDNGEKCWIKNSTFTRLISSDTLELGVVEGDPIMYEGDYPKEDAKKVYKRPVVSISPEVQEEISISNCGLSRGEFYTIINEQIIATLDVLNKEDISIDGKIIIANYTMVHNKLKNILFKEYVFSESKYDEVKTLIHIASSCIANRQEHVNIYDIDNLSEILFGYYYSIIDTLLNYENRGYT